MLIQPTSALSLSSLFAGLVAATLSGGCLEMAGPDDQVDTSAAALAEGSPGAIGVLRLLNDPATTVDLLDFEVPLPSNVARHLIAHRDGLDSVLGTADDDLYDTIDEVLAVPQMGPVRLYALYQYAATYGFVPAGTDTLGTYDGVSFTVDEAAATVALANSATLTELDEVIGLDRRAADNIVAERPILTMADLAEIPYVGGSALLKLKNF